MRSAATAEFISIMPICKAFILSAWSGKCDEMIGKRGMHPKTNIEGDTPPIPIVSFVALIATFKINARCTLQSVLDPL
jgi:hypothetical protein